MKGHKTILVTGGTGLVGSHLVKSVHERGDRVVVLAWERDPWSYFITQRLEDKAILAYGDITDRARVFDVVTSYEVDTIFHLAAQTLVPQAYLNPVQTFETNIMGTVNVLEAARQAGHVTAIVVASSDKAYGKCKETYREDDPLRGDHPYDVSKSATDLIASAYATTYGLPVTITRFGNIYGEGDLNWNRLIPGLMRAVILGHPFEIRSDGTYTRDYVYVKDVVNGYLLLVEQIEKAEGQAFNLTSHEHHSVLEVIAKVENVLGVSIEKKILNTARNEIPHQKLNDDKIRHSLGWKSEHTLQQTLPSIHAWYQSILKKTF